MRHEAMPSDLAILSAEQYLDGSFTGRTGKAKKPPTSKPETSPRKRAKVSPPAAETESAEDGDDDGAKRARGRPRLDTKDQTAAEVGRSSSVLSSRSSPPWIVPFRPSLLAAFLLAPSKTPLNPHSAHAYSAFSPPFPVITHQKTFSR